MIKEDICILRFSILPPLIIKQQSYHHTETSQLICSANQLTGFYMMATLALNELIYADVATETVFRILIQSKVSMQRNEISKTGT